MSPIGLNIYTTRILTATEEKSEIQDFCKKYAAEYKIPQNVKFVDSLPRNAAGKVIKKEL
jgi:acyl-CoA synthetase (AMP-forming)/AMP-acid ligase II